MELRDALKHVSAEQFILDDILIRPIQNDDDLWYATVECRLKPGQEDFVNPAGFSIGRAYLKPLRNVPCVICKTDRTRIGYIVLQTWMTEAAYSWSYYLDTAYQGQGYGRKAARLAVQILTAADPNRQIKLAVESENEKAQRLYESIGFRRLPELDGSDLVYGFQKESTGK